MQNMPIVSYAKALTLLDQLPSQYSKIFILTDSNTLRECLPVLFRFCPYLAAAKILTVAAGESSKSITTAAGLWAELLAAGADRKALLINLGGGMITDLGGFVASTYMRGIDFVQLPTTLLAQVDASSGGKTGVNLNGVKNIVGTFAEPVLNLQITIFLHTLPHRELISGFAEMIKHAIIAGGQHWADIRRDPPNFIYNEDLIRASIKIKSEIVAQDPREKGLRKVLNLGHTVGHAVESLSMRQDENPLLHGEAVAIGIYYEARLAQHLGYLSQDDCAAITVFLRQYYRIPTYTTDEIGELLIFMQQDKKNQSDKISFSLPFGIGDVRTDIFIDKDTITAIFHD
jgi:3-dehydroquinate synthase